MGVLNQYVTAAKKAPKEALSVFKGRHKIKNAAFAAGGAIGTYALGGIATASVIVPLLNAVGAGPLLSNRWGKRIIGGLVPFTLGYFGSKFVKGDIGKALLIGGGVASMAELAAPGMIARLVYRAAPVAVAAAPVAAVKGPVNGMEGLGGYVDAKAYQGTGDMDGVDGYVDAKAYQGTGDLDDDLEGYVDAKAYQGTGDMDDDLASDDLASDDLAGVDGYLTDSSKYMETYLN